MNFEKLLCEETIFLDIKADNEIELFKVISDNLKSKGFVKDSYLQGLINREKNYPTGLKLEKYGVAIPHTDTEHIEKEFVAIVRPLPPVFFTLMDDDEEKDSMDICFFIGLKDSKKSTDILVKLMELIQNESLILSLLKESDKKNIISHILK